MRGKPGARRRRRSVTNWLPEGLHPVAMRLARADAAAEQLTHAALAWSRGSGDVGAISLRQVERTPGTYDVEISSIRPVPPLVAMLFSEIVHHLRSAVDNAVFYVAEQEHGQAFTSEQARMVSMLIYDQCEKFDSAVKRITAGKASIPAFGPDRTLGKRIASLQPFNDKAVLSSLSPLLAHMMDVAVDDVHPLALLRDYSNEDKHRAIRVGAATAMVQPLNAGWWEGLSRGMRHVEVGMVLQQVTKGVFTGIEVSAALQVQRPNGVWVPYGPEIDGMARHVADTVIPTIVTGAARPDSIPAQIELGDNGRTLAERLQMGGMARAHERARGVITAALALADEQGWKVAPVIYENT